MPLETPRTKQIEDQIMANGQVPHEIEDAEIGRIAEDFERDGFAVIDTLASAECVAYLKAAYEDILEGRVSGGDFDRHLGGLTRQIMMPHLCHPAFADNEALRNARAIASRLIHQEAPDLLFSMAIYKPPGHPHETPWHQDMAYAGRPVTETGTILPNDAIAQFWLALEDVDADMGCMEFIPGVYDRPMPEHYVASGEPDDEGRLLAMTQPERDLDLETRVSCPLKAGGATVHGYATPHYTGPNHSATRGRPAFIFSFANPDALAAISGDRGDWGASVG